MSGFSPCDDEARGAAAESKEHDVAVIDAKPSRTVSGRLSGLRRGGCTSELRSAVKR